MEPHFGFIADIDIDYLKEQAMPSFALFDIKCLLFECIMKSNNVTSILSFK